MELKNAQLKPLRKLLAEFEDCNDLNVSKQSIAGTLVISSRSRDYISYIEADGRVIDNHHARRTREGQA